MAEASERARRRAGALASAAALLALSACSGGGSDATGSPSTTAPTSGVATSTTTTRAPSTTTTTAPPFEGWVDPASSGAPWGSEVEGLLTFRGNPTRSYYGRGPVPEAPEVRWRFPTSGGLCGQSTVGGETKTWCGTGWTGQPSVAIVDGRTEVAFGAYDRAVHVLDAASGTEVLGSFPMGDIVKGSVTRDPDGFPLIYSGSRADFHVLATDRPDGQLTDLWTLRAEDVSPTKWNDDWDSSPLVIDDFLFEGGENGQWYVVRLNRAYGADGLVTVAPEVVFHAPGWDDQLLGDLAGSGARANDVSIENSLAISGDHVYFSNSGGLVQGWDISGLREGRPPVRDLRFWTGDDTDASIVVDEDGMLYVAQEVERPSSAARNQEVGQLIKLDPSRPEDPVVWSVADDAGFWATPAIADGMVYAASDGGRLLGIDRATGEVRWEEQLTGPTWQSPVVVDDVLIQGDCDGVLRAYDVSTPGSPPPLLWSVQLEGCIESTPAVWDGTIYVGTRGGAVYAIGDAP